MTVGAETVQESGYRRCGCCGRRFPPGQVAELGQTPGVFVCAGCALWAARRAGPVSALKRGVPPALRGLLSRARRRKADPYIARSAIPILPSADLDRTAAFFKAVGFVEAERFEGYLLLHSGGVELHFSAQPGAAPGQCFVHVGDALVLWKRLRDRGVDGVGPIAEQDYGLREFMLTDPDSNRIRIGSPVTDG